MADSESLESSESFTGSDSFSSLSGPGLEDAIVDDAPSQPADTANAANEAAVVKEKSSGGLFADFNIYNAILLASLLMILLATFFLFMEASNYGGIFGSPWRTGSVGR